MVLLLHQRLFRDALKIAAKVLGNRDLSSGGVITLSLFVVALTTSTQATAAGHAACVKILSRGQDAYTVTLAAGCDLRSVARVLPQRDAASGKALPMQEQLRSIYAFNKQLADKDQNAVLAVRRGCVPGKVPSSATPEEREVCPNGLVNYYGIASVSNRAVIHVPRVRTATLAERLTTLGRKTCGTLAGVKTSYGDPEMVPSVISKTVDDCKKQLGTAVAPVDVASVPPVKAAASAAVGVKDLALGAGALEGRIRELEQGRAALVAAANDQRSESNTLIAILGAAIVLLFGTNIWTLRKARSVQAEVTSEQGSMNAEELARALVQVKKEFKAKLAALTKSHSEQLREQIAAMHRVEREYEEAIEYSRESMQKRIAKRDKVIEELERTTHTLTQQFEKAMSRSVKSEQRMEKLRARLRNAKTQDSVAAPNQSAGEALVPVS